MNWDTIGYVYVMQNERSHDIKVGFTTTSISQREKELHTTGMPVPLKTIYYVAIKNPFEVEQEVHRRLANRRISENREFFDCDPLDAIQVIHAAARDLNCSILEEWVSDGISTENKFDTTMFPERGRDTVTGTIEEVAKNLERYQGLAAILVSHAPKQASRENINKIISWTEEAIGINVRISIALLLTPDSILKIKYWCGAIPELTTNDLIKKLQEHLVQLAVASYKKPSLSELKLKVLENRQFLETQYELLKENFITTQAYRELQEIQSNAENNISEFEAFIISIPDENTLNKEQCSMITQQFKNYSPDRVFDIKECLYDCLRDAQEQFQNGHMCWNQLKGQASSFGVSQDNIDIFTTRASSYFSDTLLDNWHDTLEARFENLKSTFEHTKGAVFDRFDKLLFQIK